MAAVRVSCPHCPAVTFEVVRRGGELWLVCRRRPYHEIRPLAYLEPPPVQPPPERSEHSVYAGRPVPDPAR